MPVEGLHPEFGECLNLLVLEDLDADGRSEQTVPDYDILKQLERLLPIQMVFETVLEYRDRQLYKAAKLLEG